MEPRQLKNSDIKSLRKHILKKQNGRCWICGCKPKTACLDHHHKKRIKGTGLIRGVLCSPCNVFIAKIENNASRYGIANNELPDMIRKVADYFEKKHYPYIHPSEADKPKNVMKKSINKLVAKFKSKYPNKKLPEILIFKEYTKGKKKGKEKRKRLTVGLERLYKEFELKPEFYK